MTTQQLKNESAQRCIESAVHAVPIYYADGAHELAQPTRWLWIDMAGALTVRMASGATVSMQALPAGAMLPISITAVFLAGSDSAAIAMY